MVTETSLLAFEDIKKDLGRRQKLVYDCLKIIQPATNLMISQYLKLPINSITPRVKELRNLKLVGVAFQDRDLNTGRPSIYWRIVK